MKMWYDIADMLFAALSSSIRTVLSMLQTVVDARVVQQMKPIDWLQRRVATTSKSLAWVIENLQPALVDDDEGNNGIPDNMLSGTPTASQEPIRSS
jgi:hypothetical protein